MGDFSLFGEPFSRCYILLEVGSRHIPIKGTIDTVTDNGILVSYELEHKPYYFVHGFEKTKDGQITKRNEKRKAGRPHFLVPFGSSSDADWASGQPTAGQAVISELTHSKIAVDAILAISSQKKSGLNIKMLIIFAVIAILVMIGGYQLVGKNKGSVNPTTTPPPITTTIHGSTIPPSLTAR